MKPVFRSKPKFRAFRFVAGAMLGWMLVGSGLAAEVSRTTIPTQRGTSTARGTVAGRGVLPDPVLLDGSTQPVEKKSEFGMIGDFEIPGDENVRSGKVGGIPAGSGSQSAMENGGLPMGLPSGGGGAKGPQGKSGGGAMGPQGAQAGGGSPGPVADEKPGGGGAGQPLAEAQGIKVAELGGDPSGGMTAASGAQKPGAVTIGDKAMQISTPAQATAGVVGAQQPAGQNTQVYEKPTGTGGKPPTGQQGPNRVETGRKMPSGL